MRLSVWCTSLLAVAGLCQPPNPKPDYSFENPYTRPAKPNGLAIEKPNMIMFMPDQLRYDAVGVFGNKFVKTPNIDAFAAEGTRFTNMFVQASVCSQSRTSMFTGQYNHVTGHRTLNNLLKPWEPNMFRSLKEDGYHNTTELGVNEYGFLTNQTLPKFTAAFDYDEAMVRGALHWLECPPKEPWVLFLPLLFPHCPFTAEEPFFSMYNRSELPLPARKEDKTGFEPRFHRQIRDQYGTDRATDEVWREVKATYYAMVSRVDWQFGRIVNKTKDLGLWDQTVTMFFTDHGEYLGDYGLIEKWPSGVSDSLVHEPLIIDGAGLPKGVVYEEMGEMVDLVPTVLQLGSIPETYAQYGVSLVDAIHTTTKGEVLPHKKYSFTEGGFLVSEEPLLEQSPFPYDIKASLQHNDTSSVGKAISIRSKEWTYVYRLYEADELYSRKGDDAQELHNLAERPEYQRVRATLREEVFKWLVETADTIPWYEDQRRPSVTLANPHEQYVMREEKCDDCPPY
ncbi:alkaline-phosphatase-like protein [Apiospora hydei]|uniref:Alkaline-phosphatase-like protein n=1 Tax=Apiospora hydei TaxID=1337664 RepID=A0ABR1WNS4_9PEZI